MDLPCVHFLWLITWDLNIVNAWVASPLSIACSICNLFTSWIKKKDSSFVGFGDNELKQWLISRARQPGSLKKSTNVWSIDVVFTLNIIFLLWCFRLWPSGDKFFFLEHNRCRVDLMQWVMLDWWQYIIYNTHGYWLFKYNLLNCPN
jgi:hypothetical protein